MRERPLHERPGHLVNRAARLLMRLAESRFRPMGLGVASFPVLNMLRTGEKLSQKEMTSRARIEQSSMAQLLTRLERDGMIERTPDPNDGRSTLISLSGKAVALLPQVDQLINVGNDQATAGMSDAEIDLLVNLLQRLIGNLEDVAKNGDPSV